MAARRAIFRTAPRNTTAFLPRFYASSTRGEAGATTNVRDSPSASQESSSVNSSRGAERHGTSTGGSPDSASVQTPVSHPSEANAATSEEPQPSQDNVRSDPSEPDHVKRQKVEEAGQTPLDPAN
ncbi:hypothetical protein BAUCODRAFT_38204, partial [Baudoinia panamericana UAMH 10762]